MRGGPTAARPSMVRVSVTYTVFGEMTVHVDGVRQVLTRRRERGVLSVLLASHGAPVAADRLLAEVWGEEAAGQTLGSLQVAVSRLRTILEPGRSPRQGSRLVSTAAGYALRAEPDDVDAWRFEARAEAALCAPLPDERLRLADAALDLWTSAPYPDGEAPIVRRDADRLEELRLTVVEHRTRAMLDLGRPEEALRALAALAADHPFRERLWSLLALAQYQCARQADALTTLRRLRTALADELGVDPSAEVQHLERAVLRQDPALAAPVPTSSRPPRDQPLRDQPLRDQPRRTPEGDPGTVGRQPVLDQAISQLESARATRSARFLLVAGEPGIGKSRLVDDLGAHAAAAGFRVLVGRCHEGDYAPALWPWLGIVRALAADESEPTGRDPLLRPLLDADLDTSAEGAGAGLRMFDAVVELVVRTATDRPLLLVLEDIHWADATSLQLLRHLAGALVPAAVAVVCTRRTTEPSATPELVDTMAALARAGAERVRLDGLDVVSVGTLLRLTVGDHDSRLDTVVAEITGGNPFFVLQYARLLAGLPDLDSVDPAALPVPDGIRDVLRQRILRLPPEGQQTLVCASVLGHRIDPDRLTDLAGLPLDECLDLLDLAMTSGLVVESGTGYEFVHALARETAYGELSAARRMRLHDRAGRVVEQHQGQEADAGAAIAHHSHLAAPLGPEHARRACAWLARAAEVASGRHAHAEALDLWRQVLADAPAGSETTVLARCGEAGALLRLARTTEARESVDDAVRLARTLGRWDLVAGAARILNGAGVWSWREHGIRDAAFIEVLSQAAEHVAPADRARLLATLQMEHYYGWDGAVADRLGSESVEVARRCGDPGLLLEVLLVRIIATWGPQRARQRLALIEEVLSHEPVGELRVFILFQLGAALYELSEPERADATMDECADEAAALRHTGVEIPLGWWRYARARGLDDPAAPTLGAEALALHRTSGYIAGSDLEVIATIRGVAPGTPVPPETVAAARTANPGLRAMVAHAVLEAGDRGTAYSLLGEPAPPGASDYSVLAGHCLRVLVLAGTGTPEEVSEALARITPFADEVVTYGTVDHLGVVTHFLACGYAALGDPRALEHAERAVVLNARLQCAPWRRRSEALVARLS